jgi:uncharacterized protein (DUF427 family)
LKNVYDSRDINRVWENVSEHVNISAKDSISQYERRKNMAWLYETAEKCLEQINQAKLQ